MKPLSFLKRHISFKRSPPSSPPHSQNENKTSTSTSTSPLPPPSPPTYTPSSAPRILASDTPQWTWSNTQCKSWLYEVCTTMLNYSSEEGEALAEKFVGFGPTLYAMERAEWRALLGRYDGMGVYSLLVGVRGREGAVPEGVDVEDGRVGRKERKGSKKSKESEGR